MLSQQVGFVTFWLNDLAQVTIPCFSMSYLSVASFFLSKIIEQQDIATPPSIIFIGRMINLPMLESIN